MIRPATLALLLLAAPDGGAPELEARLKKDRKALRAPATREEARRDLRELAGLLESEVAAHPEAARPHLLLGRARLYLEEADRARSELDAAGRLAPDDPEAAFYQGYVRSSAQDFQGARPYLERSTRLAPKVPRGFAELGRVLLELHDNKGAKQALLQARALGSDDPYVAFDLANALSALGEHEQALPLYEEAARRDPDLTDAQFNAGLGHQLRSDPAGARPYFEAVARKEPEDFLAQTKLVQVYQALGLTRERDAARERVLALHQQGKTRGIDFGREQFALGHEWIHASEVYEPAPPLNVRYRFSVLPDPHSTRPRITFSLESFDGDQDLARSEHRLPEGVRLYSLDANTPDGSHFTYGFFQGEPSYEEVRRRVSEILTKKLKPLSSTTVRRR